MKLYFGIKYHADFSNRPLIEEFLESFEHMGFETCCVVRDLEEWGAVSFTPQQLMQKTFEIIEACDVVVIELSEKGVGLGIEAGYAHAKGKAIITIAKEGSDISETLRGISKDVFMYKRVDELKAYFLQQM